MKNEVFKRLKAEAFRTTEWEKLNYDKILERVVELTVKECTQICDTKRIEYTKLCKDAESFEDMNLYAEGEISAHRIRILIKEHFGVEE